MENKSVQKLQESIKDQHLESIKYLFLPENFNETIIINFLNKSNQAVKFNEIFVGENDKK